MTYKLTNTTSVIRTADGAFIPADPANTDFAAYQAWLAEGNTPEPLAMTQAEIIATYESSLDAHLDSVAQANRFKDRHSLALRAGYVSPYQALGLAFAQWMDCCNFAAYQRLQRVIDGVEPMPTVEEFLASLPEFVAP